MLAGLYSSEGSVLEVSYITVHVIHLSDAFIQSDIQTVHVEGTAED